MRETKKKWEKPKLIVVVKARSEEAVLDACKHGASNGGGNNNAGSGDCWDDPGITPSSGHSSS